MSAFGVRRLAAAFQYGRGSVDLPDSRQQDDQRFSLSLPARSEEGTTNHTNDTNRIARICVIRASG
jgi:hypothetical protein